MIKNAKKSITFMTTSKGVIRKIEALKPELEKLAKKGVSIRIAVPITKENLNAVQEISKIAEIRNNDGIKARFVLVDAKELMFMALDDEEVHPSYDLGIWVNTPYFTTALETMFNSTWKDMETLNKVVARIK